MAAIGSVIVMAVWALSRCGFRPAVPVGPSAFLWVLVELPAGLGDAGELAAVGHLPQADPAQAELAVDGLGPAATLAAGVATPRELGLAGRLDSQSCLRHVLIPSQRSAKGNPS